MKSALDAALMAPSGATLRGPSLPVDSIKRCLTNAKTCFFVHFVYLYA